MWRETHVFGVYVSPLLAYALVALLLAWPVRLLLLRSRLARIVPNPALPQLSIYLCILAALLACL